MTACYSPARFRIFPNSLSPGSISILPWLLALGRCDNPCFASGFGVLGAKGKAGGLAGGRRGFAGLAVSRLGALPVYVPSLAAVQPRPIALHSPHAVLGARLQRGGDLKEVTVADEVLHRMSWHENLAFRHADV